MKIYDLKQNKVVQFPDYIARIKLRSKHISKGGYYCTVQDIEKYVATPPVVNPVHMIVSAEIAQPEMHYPEEVTDTTDDALVVKKRRKRKTE